MPDDSQCNRLGQSHGTGRLDVTFVTRAGVVPHVGPANPDDETLLEEFFAHVTPEDLRFRFLGGMREVSHERLLAMTHVDRELTENVLALADGGKAIIATAMLAFDRSMTKAEVAISVRADHKHKGVAWELLGHVARYAQARGVVAWNPSRAANTMRP